MLHRLVIRGLALIDEADLNFDQNFSVVTGETGAGKSMLLRAFGLLLGEKANAETVRTGKSEAVVSASFHVGSRHPVVDILDGAGLKDSVDRGEAGGGLELVVRRHVSIKGRSQAYVNDVPISIGLLRQISTPLIEFFGQHETQGLLNPASHLAVVDELLADKSLSLRVESLFDEVTDKVREIASLLEKFQDAQRQRDYLEYRLEEWRAFHPTADDYALVQRTCQVAGTSERGRRLIGEAVATLEQGVSGESVTQLLGRAIRLVRDTADASLEEVAQQLLQACENLERASFTLTRAGDRYEYDEAQLEDAQARLATYQSLFRKYNVTTIGDLLAEGQRLEETSLAASEVSAKISAILSEIERILVHLEKASADLGSARHHARKVLVDGVAKELRDLAMSGAALDVVFSPVRGAVSQLDWDGVHGEVVQTWQRLAPRLIALTRQGAEDAVLYLRSNKGEQAQPLHKVASGGELSRIVLALKMIGVGRRDSKVHVFDEIDTGVSGRVADIMGRKMKQLSGECQIICVSHLPQVAAHAQAHMVVEKSQAGSRTVTRVRLVSGDDSLREIAKLLSGEAVTKTSLAHAKTLVDKAVH